MDEEYYDDPGDGHECEGRDYWKDDDGKSGIDECGRTDTEWYEMNGEAGYFCPSHRP